MVQLIGVDFEVFGRVQGKRILSFNIKNYDDINFRFSFLKVYSLEK